MQLARQAANSLPQRRSPTSIPLCFCHVVYQAIAAAKAGTLNVQLEARSKEHLDNISYMHQASLEKKLAVIHLIALMSGSPNQGPSGSFKRARVFFLKLWGA